MDRESVLCTDKQTLENNLSLSAQGIIVVNDLRYAS